MVTWPSTRRRPAWPTWACTAGRIDPTRVTTHRFALADALEGYDTFAGAGETNALRMPLAADG